MRRSIPIIVLALFSLLAAASVKAGAQEPDAEEELRIAPNEPVLSRDAADQIELNPTDVQHRAKGMESDNATAELVMRIEEAAAPVSGVLATQHPDVFGGSWLNDGDTQGITVAIVRGRDTTGLLSDLEQNFPYPDRVQIVEVDRSLADLNADMETLSRDLNLYPDWAPRGKTALIERENRIVVTVYAAGDTNSRASDAQAHLAELQSRYPDIPIDLVIDDGEAPQLLSCTRTNCQWTMRGGLRILHGTNTCNQGDDCCTTGFNVTKNNVAYMVTAGHCSSQTGTWWKQGTNGHYGRVEGRSFINNADEDAEITLHESNPWLTFGFFLGNNAQDIRDVDDTSCWGCYQVGQWSGISGAKGGTTKGRISSTNVSIDFDDPYSNGKVTIRELVEADFCAIGWPSPVGGDSGGAVFRNDTAQGILAGGDSCHFFIVRQHNINERFSVGVIGG